MRTVLFSTVLAAALAGCGGPPPPPPTLVSVTITAEPRSNNGAPLSLRVYQLASPVAFEAAQFFPLYNGDAALLKDDLIKRDDVLLAPGQSKTLALKPTDKVTPADLPRPAEMEKRAKRWHPWCSVASWYLWRACDLARPDAAAKQPV